MNGMSHGSQHNKMSNTCWLSERENWQVDLVVTYSSNVHLARSLASVIPTATVHFEFRHVTFAGSRTTDCEETLRPVFHGNTSTEQADLSVEYTALYLINSFGHRFSRSIVTACHCVRLFWSVFYYCQIHKNDFNKKNYT